MRSHSHISACSLGLVFLFAAALCLFPVSSAFAQSIGWTLCRIYSYSLGSSYIARGIATVGVAALALAAMFGKATWGMAITVGVGISGLFGAAVLYNQLIGHGTCVGI